VVARPEEREFEETDGTAPEIGHAEIRHAEIDEQTSLTSEAPFTMMPL
jgi:hypothetical protein